ncbi:DUF4350 domain-containing protein [Nocardiopsis sp. CC223A]|uniref:DUF4350 domain-containing protein n=1 Tax=Nocardiopsis sp. CC223A TaxID=3044051 RepID=UPI00278C144B|nr:DUF4350 domain-containing protein [Nocardiopsis sp. CC223A]
MTVHSPEAPAVPAPADAPPESAVRRLWRAARFPAVLAAALIVVSVLMSLGDEQFPTGHLEPGSVSPDGTRALVNVLSEDREVEVVRSSGDAAAAVGAADDAVLVVFLDHRLLPEELDRLAALDVDTVLVRPSVRSLSAFAPGVEMTGRELPRDILERPLEPHCDLPAAASAGPAYVHGELYTADPGVDAVGCYPAGAGDALVQVSEDGTTTTVLGNGGPWANRLLDRGGDAALALNLLDAGTVVWLRPDPPRQEGTASLTELLPAGVRWSLLPLAVGLVLLVVWQGRRMGALVPESLPVVVRASETTEGRAGLYRSRTARDRVTGALRTGFLERHTARLGLGPDAPPDAVVAAVAERTGDDPQAVRELLYPPGPDPYAADDEGLLRLAAELDERSRRLR